MRVLVAGATGAVGSRLIPLLVQAGHSVVGMARRPDGAAAIERDGAAAAIVDALDAEAVREAVLGARPDVVVHQLTALRGVTDLRDFDQALAQSNLLRTKGLDYLLAAAVEAGTRRVVVQSYCGWPYAPSGGPVKSETDPLDPDPPRRMRRTLDAILHLERATTTGQMDGVVLRYGSFYGPDMGVLSDTILDQIRRRRFPILGSGGGWWSFVHIDDVAVATAVAVERGAPGIYNIVDDEPAPVDQWLPELATLLGVRPPPRLPGWLGRLLVGEPMVRMMTAVRAGSNAKARRELRWSPKHASWRQGFARVLAAPVHRER